MLVLDGLKKKFQFDAGWSSLAARWAHNPKVEGSNPSPATTFQRFGSSVAELAPIRERGKAGRNPDESVQPPRFESWLKRHYKEST